MATLPNDIPVATVEQVRRRDEVLPEHEEKYPATERVRAMVTDQYDGTSSTSKAIGNACHAPKTGEAYPSWRIEQIAQALGLADEKHDEVILRSRQQDANEKTARSRTQGARPEIKTLAKAIAVIGQGEPTPTRTLLLEDLSVIKNEDPHCEVCGQQFEPWKHGRGFMTRKCRACFSAKMSGQLLQHRTEKVKPDAEAPRSEPKVEPKAETAAEAAPEPQRLTVAPTHTPLRRFHELPEARMVGQLVDMLPTNGRWSSRRREVWLKALAATLDLIIEVEPERTAQAEEVAR